MVGEFPGQICHLAPSSVSVRVSVLHSCNTVLTNIKNQIMTAKDLGQVIASLLFDLSKAFDTINHDILFATCSHVNIGNDACQLLSRCLQGRQQSVQINAKRSSLKRSAWINSWTVALHSVRLCAAKLPKILLCASVCRRYSYIIISVPTVSNFL